MLINVSLRIEYRSITVGWVERMNTQKYDDFAAVAAINKPGNTRKRVKPNALSHMPRLGVLGFAIPTSKNRGLKISSLGINDRSLRLLPLNPTYIEDLFQTYVTYRKIF